MSTRAMSKRAGALLKRATASALVEGRDHDPEAEAFQRAPHDDPHGILVVDDEDVLALAPGPGGRGSGFAGSPFTVRDSPASVVGRKTEKVVPIPSLGDKA